MRSAESGCVWMSDEIACSVLNRKCGWSSRLERFQPRLGQAGLELRRLERAGLRLAVVPQRVAQPDDGRVRHQRPVEIREEDALNEPEEIVPRSAYDCRNVLGHSATRSPTMQARCRTENAGHAERMGAERPRPPDGIDREAMGDPEDRRGQRRGHVPVGEVQHQQAPHLDVHRVFDVERRQPVGLERGKDAQKRRRAEDQPYRRRPGFLHCFNYRALARIPSSMESPPTMPIEAAVRGSGQAAGHHQLRQSVTGFEPFVPGTVFEASSTLFRREHNQRRVVLKRAAGERGDRLRQPCLERRRAARPVLDRERDQALLRRIRCRPCLRASVMPSVKSTRRSPAPIGHASLFVGRVREHAHDRTAGNEALDRCRRREPGLAGSGRRWQRSARPMSLSKVQ